MGGLRFPCICTARCAAGVESLMAVRVTAKTSGPALVTLTTTRRGRARVNTH